ncbi:TonB-dependent receptor domain-containing protein [Caulobacter sp. 17J80-11]|uniref:TonB-dependent receptor domain-containing protein n=1 Tax=Caulobacter sp. 17J80-11 TaxID=2763502 RepID=UPI00351C99B8
MKVWRSALLCSAALMVTGGAGAAWAQSEEAPAPAKQTEATAGEAASDPAVEELIVVGSRIRRDTFNSPSPIQIMTREETTLAGYSSTTAALQGTAVTGGSAQINNAYGGYVTDGGPGANTIGLRGLGAGRTLVLIDGRRVAPAGSRGSVGSADLNVLPSAMIDRVEVLRDGASSVYGSDAIAGVINVITRKPFEGVTVEGQYNAPTNGGGEQTRLSVTGGLMGDRWNLSGSLEFYERQDLTLADRDWTRCNTDHRINRATGGVTDFIDPATGRPKCYPITGTGSNGVTINTIGTSNMAGVGAAGAPGSVTQFNRWRPNSSVTTGLVGWEGVGGTGVNVNVRDTFEDEMLGESLISPVEVKTAYLKGGYDLHALGNAEVYGEVLINQRDSTQASYRQLALDYMKGSPLIPAELAGSTAMGPTEISNGQDVGVRAFIGAGLDQSSQSVTFWKGTAGIRGDLFLNDWRYDVAVTRSRSDADYSMMSFLKDRLSKSLDVVDIGGGVFACRDADPACVAAPALTPAVVGGALPADWKNYVFQNVVGNTQYDETVLSAAIDGPLYELPAGTVMGAFGVEYRKAEIDDTPSIHSQQGNLLNLTSSEPTRGEDSVWEVYGELEVPILRDLPFAHDLTLNVSGRYTNYDSYGSDSTYKVGGVWTPIPAVSLRATYGTSFRAPALFEQFQGATSGFLDQSYDPCSEYGTEAAPDSFLYANCHAELGDTDFKATSGVTVLSEGGAGAGLEAETSKNFTVGLILQPELPDAFGEFAFAVDYYKIEINNGVSRVGGAAILDLCYNDPEFRAGGGWCRFIEERGEGAKLVVHDQYTNIATQNVEGIDYNLRWVKDIGPGSLRLNAQVTQYLDQSSKLFADDPMDDVNGTIGNPEFTGTFDATYALDKVKFRYGVEWIDDMQSYDYFGLNRATTAYDFDVPDYWTHNASVQYSADDWTATVGIRNIGDKEPPMISSGAYSRVGNAPLYSGYDYVGRTVFVNVSKSF